MPHSHKLEEVGNCLETFSLLVTSLSSVCENGQHAFSAVKQLSTTSNQMGIFCFLKDPKKRYLSYIKNQKFKSAKSFSKF